MRAYDNRLCHKKFPQLGKIGIYAAVRVQIYKLLLRWICAVQPAETLPFHSRGGLYNGVLEYVGVKIALPHILRGTTESKASSRMESVSPRSVIHTMKTASGIYFLQSGRARGLYANNWRR